MEIPRLGVELELQLQAYTAATATPNWSRICDLHHISWQYWILNPLIRPGVEPMSSWILVGFISAVPQWELLCFLININTGISFNFLSFVFLGSHLQHMEVPRLEVESELQLQTYTTARATLDLSCIYDLHHSSQQCQILTH